MRIFKYLRTEDNEKTFSEISVDENGDFRKVTTFGYDIHLKCDEYATSVDYVYKNIVRALAHGIDVYCSNAHANRFNLLDKFALTKKNVVLSNDFIISFSTTDESKYELLEKVVKNIAIYVKECRKEEYK